MEAFNLVLFLAHSLFGVDVTPTVKAEEPPAIIEEVSTKELAQCLTESGAKFYGAYWCGHCSNQKELFGDDVQYLTYIECDPGGENPDPEACRQAGIKAFPTWILGDGTALVGTQQLETLAEKADC